MKNLKLFLPLTLSLSAIPIFTQSCFYYSENDLNNNGNTSKPSEDVISVEIPDIFKFNDQKLNDEIRKIKNKLKKTIEYSNLVQWNEYYSKANPPFKTKIWEPRSGQEDIYKNQDNQFQYFNNFIHTNNNISGTPSSKQSDQRSFLFERAYLFILEAHKNWRESKIYHTRLTDVISAMAEAGASAGANIEKIKGIWSDFSKYSSSKQLGQTKTIFNDLNLRFPILEMDDNNNKELKKYFETSKNILKSWDNLVSGIIERIFTSDGVEIPKELEDLKKFFSATLRKLLLEKEVSESDFYSSTPIIK